MRAGGHDFVMRAARALSAVALAGVLGLALSACGASGTDPTAVPTFPEPEQAAGPSAGGSDDGRVVPDDCGRILAAPDLEAVLGLPLGSVGVRTTIGVASPAVDRTERVSCTYTRSGDSDRNLLYINSTAYTNPSAAHSQWQINVDAESGEPREVPLGSASAVFFEKEDEAVLRVAHSTSNLTLVLPNQPLPADRTRVDAITDLALRVLPAVSVATSSAPVPGVTSMVAPQAGGPR